MWLALLVSFSKQSAPNVLPLIVLNVISVVLFISPVTTSYKIIRRKAVEKFMPDAYLETVLNCLLWVFFGMPFVQPDSLLVVTINSVGLVLELIYLAIFFIYATDNGRVMAYWLCGEVVFYVIVILVTMLAFHDTKNRSLFVGILCDIFNIIMYSFPLTVMIDMQINTYPFRCFNSSRSSEPRVEYMPFTLSLANFLNSCVWTAYALIKPDIYVLVSNSIGAVFGSIQLIL
ncbi:hypothetical protein UlMin_021325 [Ulmus minor]